MMAGGAIDLDEIAAPEILDPSQVQGLHSGLRSWNVLSYGRGPRQRRLHFIHRPISAAGVFALGLALRLFASGWVGGSFPYRV
jgi:hypothetical protein